MNWKYIFNPFLKYSERQLLAVGILGYLLTIFVSWQTKMQADSIFHLSPNPNLSLPAAAEKISLGYLLAIAFLWALGKIFNVKTRLIDIVNTVLLSQVFNPIIMAASKLSSSAEIAQKASENTAISPNELIPMLLSLVVVLPLMIFSIVLYYNGFKTATNIKSWQKNTVFAVASFIFIILCQTFLPQIKL